MMSGLFVCVRVDIDNITFKKMPNITALYLATINIMLKDDSYLDDLYRFVCFCCLCSFGLNYEEA